jgi:preprotein translocase subunit SecA
MLAVLLAIKKKEVVDIITSSPVLAKRDAEELAKFYQHFGLTVSHNVDEKEKEESDSMLACYQANIVYGDSHSFEGDILRHEYSE